MSKDQHDIIMEKLDFGIRTIRANRIVIESASISIRDSKDNIFMQNTLEYSEIIERRIGEGIHELRSCC